MDKVIFEIQVDRNNEKWPWVFEHILIILHKTIESKKESFWKQPIYKRPEFSFEIAKIWNKIRFFVICKKEYKNFLQNQIYAHYSNVEIFETNDYLSCVPIEKIKASKIVFEKPSFFPIKTFTELQWEQVNNIDPYSSLTASLSKTSNNTINLFQINFSPYPDSFLQKEFDKKYKIFTSSYPEIIKKILLNFDFRYLKIFLLPFSLFLKLISLFIPKNTQDQEEKQEKEEKIDVPEEIKNKLEKPHYWVNMSIVCISEDELESKMNIKEIFSTLWVFSYYWYNSFVLNDIIENEEEIKNIVLRRSSDDFILSTTELSWLVHLPTSYVKTPWINWVLSRNFEPPSNLQILTSNETELTPIWITNFRRNRLPFWIWINDRRRHMYIIWKTWMWKSTLLENMIIDDIKKWRGVAVIDPHWDLAENIIWNIPKSRTNNTIIFDPSDTNWPIAFNMLDWVSKEHRPLIASGLVSIFKKIFWDSWGPRLEHILRNTILALLEYPNTTLISVPLMLTSDVYRNKVIAKITDPVVKKFWVWEFAKMNPNQKVERAGPILNKVWQFLSSSILRNILWQPKNSFSLRWAMDNQKIVIINLSKWKIWEDASALLWAMMVTKFQMDAMSRADIKESERKDFYLYVDEFQNFATDSFATILSEARKYKLNLVMANQYIDQMQETVKWAVFWNVWTIISFQVWYHDSVIMKEVFWSEVLSDDLTNLRKYSIYIKQLIDWMPSKVFSADTFPPSSLDPWIFEVRYNKILKVSREKYAKDKKIVEDKIYKTIKDIENQEKKWEELLAKQKEKKKK